MITQKDGQLESVDDFICLGREIASTEENVKMIIIDRAYTTLNKKYDCQSSLLDVL